MRYCLSHSNRGTSDTAEIDPDRFTLRQVDALREDYAQVMEELDLVKELLARLPTRREQAFTPASHHVRDSSRLVRAGHRLVRNLLAALPLA